ncbi:MAG: DUF4430 domain-containing protein [Bacteroidales bacterium]|nr:DUF4430 domain-containing protein [Bacteroidales bacterium]
MKHFKIISILSIALLISCTEKAAKETVLADTDATQQYITVQWGDSTTIETSTVTWYEGITALTALQNAAIVETHPVEKHIFVTSINGKQTQRGITAWYYTVNRKSPDKLAFRNQLQVNDTIKWIFKKDVCSPKFDSVHCKSESNK